MYGIVSQAGGQIHVVSARGAGTTLKLFFPRSEKPLSAIGEVPLGPEAGPEPAPGSGLVLLVVEDDEAIRQLTCECLRSGGYRVLAAADGGQALEAVTQALEPIDLVVTDVVMPTLGGPELVRALRGRWPGLPVLYTSGYTGHDPTELGLVAGQVELLHKPFSLRSLLDRVRALVAARPR